MISEKECILITGSLGMVGTHLIEFYENKNLSIVATYYKPTVELKTFSTKHHLIECDVRYFNHLYTILSKYLPTKIFHLAAQSYPTVSLDRPNETFDTNVTGTINLFEGIKHLKKIDKNYDPIVLVACSSAEYGASLSVDNVPIKENVILQPLHPYGVSKVAQDLLAYQYFINYDIKSIRVRIFNTTGPRKVNDVTSDFTKRAIEIEKGYTKTFKVGNLDTQRSITDVRDLIRALDLLALKGNPGDVYNVSGEKVYKIKELLDIIKKFVTFDFEIVQDPQLMREVDEPIIFGDSSKLKKETGWKQEYNLEQTIKDMLEYWRKVL